MKIDYIVSNPPYNMQLHLKFLRRYFDFAERIICVQPASFLITLKESSNLNKPGSLGDDIKTRMEGHTKYIEIDNLNIEFGTALGVPFCISYIDFTRIYDTIIFKKVTNVLNVNSIYDCNLVGDRNLIYDILRKCKNFPVKVKDRHVNLEKYKDYETPENYFLKISSMVGYSLTFTCRFMRHTKETWPVYADYPVLRSHNMYFNRMLFDTNILKNVPTTMRGNQFRKGFHAQACLYGTKEELSNWIYNATHLKLLVFIQICLNINATSSSAEFTPFLSDKHYTDEELYNLLDINKKEQELIDNTLKLYSADTDFFQKYFRITSYEKQE